jgi:hypothetical protein
MTSWWQRSVLLLPIGHHDLPVLLEWRNSETFGTLCSKRRSVVTLELFVKELKSDFETDRLEQAMIYNLKGSALGTVYSYGHSKEDGYLYLTI